MGFLKLLLIAFFLLLIPFSQINNVLAQTSSQNITNPAIHEQSNGQDMNSIMDSTYPGFGGMFLDNSGKLNVYVMDPAKAESIGIKAITDIFGKEQEVKGVVFLKGNQTLHTWSQWQDIVTGSLMSNRTLGIDLVGLDQMNQTLDIGLESFDKDKKDAVEAFLIAHQIPLDMVTLIQMKICPLAGPYSCQPLERLVINALSDYNKNHQHDSSTSSQYQLKGVLSPMQQMSNGISPKNVVCFDNLVLIKKAHTNSAACVKPKTAQKLAERHWGLIYTHVGDGSYVGLLPFRTTVNGSSDIATLVIKSGETKQVDVHVITMGSIVGTVKVMKNYPDCKTANPSSRCFHGINATVSNSTVSGDQHLVLTVNVPEAMLPNVYVFDMEIFAVQSTIPKDMPQNIGESVLFDVKVEE